MDDPFRTFDELRNAYLRYLDSPFRLRYGALMDERRKLLDQDRQLYRRPLFEPIVPYESSGLSIHDACTRLGVAAEAGEFISRGLFPASRRLYRHQYQAWEASRTGSAVVVTSATNSGKTECYLIPVFAGLVEESARWGAPAQPAAPWWNSPGGRRSQRSHETANRPAAVRALFLYPLNALIEDQLGRIREACDGRAAREWMAQNRPGHHFWFGRYTGATPVAGLPTNENKRGELRRRLRVMHREWDRAVASAAANGDDRILNYFQDPSGSEMWSRWDMQDHPPDILITNYSMLNIMLMRGVEEAVLDRTRAWLATDPSNLFHLVVDELHSYRGTPGTEVGYLLRALLERLGLTPDSPQLRIIATSASIENNAASREYLEQFFGRDRDAFTVIGGDRKRFPVGTGSLPGRIQSFLRAGSAIDSGAEGAVEELAGDRATGEQAPRILAAHLSDSGALEAVRRAGEAAPFTIEDLALRVFGSSDKEAVGAARGLARCLAAARNDEDAAPLPLRVHFFFHNAGRLWVCTNPQCSGRFGQTPAGADLPPVGRLYTEPRPRCDSCHAAVLELLYCQPCGEVLLGGFQKPDPDSPNAWFVCPDYPDLDRVPDRSASLKRSAADYIVFWPASGRRLAQTTHQTGPQWQWQQDGQRGWRWTPALLDHYTARLTKPPRAQDSAPGRTGGYLFVSPEPDANAFPSKCPHCGADWARRRVGSPIRDLGSGFQRVVQLLCDAMLRELDPHTRKLVLFSDSRSDAAKLSTGIKLAHHLDTLRQIAYEALAGAGTAAIAAYAEALEVHQRAVELASLERRQQLLPLSSQEFAQRQKLLGELPPEVLGEILRYVAVGAEPPAALTPPSAPGGFAATPFNDLLHAARTRLLNVGMNPGGPQPSVTKYLPRVRRAGIVWWDSLFDWNASPRGYRAGLQPVEQQLLNQIESMLRRSVIQDVLFADGSRDFESLNLGFLWVDTDGPATAADQATASVVRMLAQRRRWRDSDAEGQLPAPMYIQNYLSKVADLSGVNPIALHGVHPTIVVEVRRPG